MRSRLKPRVLAELADCTQQLASNALETLKAQRLLELGAGGYALTAKGREAPVA
jgi:Mn-dependent DtxR family transcriptional regulator